MQNFFNFSGLEKILLKVSSVRFQQKIPLVSYLLIKCHFLKYLFPNPATPFTYPTWTRQACGERDIHGPKIVSQPKWRSPVHRRPTRIVCGKIAQCLKSFDSQLVVKLILPRQDNSVESLLATHASASHYYSPKWVGTWSHVPVALRQWGGTTPTVLTDKEGYIHWYNTADQSFISKSEFGIEKAACHKGSRITSFQLIVRPLLRLLSVWILE